MKQLGLLLTYSLPHELTLIKHGKLQVMLNAQIKHHKTLSLYKVSLLISHFNCHYNEHAMEFGP